MSYFSRVKNFGYFIYFLNAIKARGAKSTDSRKKECTKLSIKATAVRYYQHTFKDRAVWSIIKQRLKRRRRYLSIHVTNDSVYFWTYLAAV